MISRLRGTVAARTGAGLVIDVGGVGYLVAATPRVNAAVGQETTVETHLHVREDALQLYGFASADERELFELLLGVTGIGPKVALAIVSGSTPGRAPPCDRARRPRTLRGDPGNRPQDRAAGRSWS